MGLFGNDSPEEEKIKELVGGFLYSKTLEKKLTNANLIPISDYFVDIQKTFKEGVKANNIPIDEMESYLDKIIFDKANNLTGSQKEKTDKEVSKKQKIWVLVMKKELIMFLNVILEKEEPILVVNGNLI